MNRWLGALMVVALARCAHVAEPPSDEQPKAAPPAVSDASQQGKTMAHPAVPKTRTQLIEDMLFGVKVKDPYRWLEDEKSDEVQQWLAAQNAAARVRLDSVPARPALLNRFTELYYIDAVSAPIRRGGRYFFTRRHKDQEKAVVYVKASATAPEQVLLDPNAWSTDNTVALGVWAPSWDGKKVAFAERPNAADEATLYVLDVDTKERSKVDVIAGAKYASPAWAPDGKGFYYEWLPTDPKIPVPERPGYTELRYHALGTDPAKDVVVHERLNDPQTFLNVGLSRDGKYLFAYHSRGWNENDIYFRRLGKGGDEKWRLLVKGQDAKYSVDVWKDVFYVTTDEGAPNMRVFKADPKKPERAAWRELIPEQKDAAIESVTLVGGHLAVNSLKNVVSQIQLFDLNGKLLRSVELPGLGTASNLIGLEDEDEAYYSFSSFVMPPQIFKTSVKSGATEVWAKLEVPVDPSPYTVEQAFYASKDGTQVPMFIVARKDLKKDGSNPTLLYGYGGFAISLTSAFNQGIYPWLEAGGVYAVANLRGGAELGKRWHDAGRGANKQNVFDDFAGAAEYLIAQGYTTPKKLAIRGGSNGGLLVGAAMTQRPELYGAVVCSVPLLDMLRYHLYGSGKTWIAEYGDPDKAEDFKVLEAYSPYHHVIDGKQYPALLMDAADHDDRVDPMHARKFIARVQQATHGKQVAWLRVEQHAGHGGADQVKQAVARSADVLAFLFTALDVRPGAAAAGRVAPGAQSAPTGSAANVGAAATNQPSVSQ